MFGRRQGLKEKRKDEGATHNLNVTRLSKLAKMCWWAQYGPWAIACSSLLDSHKTVEEAKPSAAVSHLVYFFLSGFQ